MGDLYGRPWAAAYVRGGGAAPKLRGCVSFYPRWGGTLVVADICGLPEASETGFFALHIHEGDSCAGADFEGTGRHWNPTGAAHPNHAGDLPPLLSCRGRAYMAVLTGRFRPEEAVGRTVVIHSGADDFHTQPAGNPGRMIACGVIQRMGTRL